LLGATVYTAWPAPRLRGDKLALRRTPFGAAKAGGGFDPVQSFALAAKSLVTLDYQIYAKTAIVTMNYYTLIYLRF
jgi:hypothetical protein